MQVRFGINTGFALNRYTPPSEWIPFVAEELGLNYVQFTADLLNPSMPDTLVKKQLELTRNYLDRYRVQVGSVFTSAFTRVNHFSHPDADLRAYWIQWFERLVDVASGLGAEGIGSHLAILTVKDLNDEASRNKRFAETVACWRHISSYAKAKGLRYLTWEPMSTPREYGETIAEVERIQSALKKDFELPFYLCLDVDHGEVCSTNPDDTNPYCYLEKFAVETRQVHLKQSHKDKGGHWPFSAEHNQKGQIQPAEVLASLEKGGAQDVDLFLELSFRERTPAELRMVSDLKESVAFWRPHLAS